MLPQAHPTKMCSAELGQSKGGGGSSMGGWNVWDRMLHWAESVHQGSHQELREMCTGLIGKVG